MLASVTATRRTEPGDVERFLRVIERLEPGSKIYVGGARGGDCMAALAAIALGYEVHTILPHLDAQLCQHWQKWLSRGGADPPHTNGYIMLPSQPEPYRRRNESLIDHGRDLLLAFPDRQEQQAHSGVTMTINIARKAGVPVEVHILHGEIQS